MLGASISAPAQSPLTSLLETVMGFAVNALEIGRVDLAILSLGYLRSGLEADSCLAEDVGSNQESDHIFADADMHALPGLFLFLQPVAAAPVQLDVPLFKSLVHMPQQPWSLRGARCCDQHSPKRNPQPTHYKKQNVRLHGGR